VIQGASLWNLKETHKALRWCGPYPIFCLARSGFGFFQNCVLLRINHPAVPNMYKMVTMMQFNLSKIRLLRFMW